MLRRPGCGPGTSEMARNSLEEPTASHCQPRSAKEDQNEVSEWSQFLYSSVGRTSDFPCYITAVDTDFCNLQCVCVCVRTWHAYVCICESVCVQEHIETRDAHAAEVTGYCKLSDKGCMPSTRALCAHNHWAIPAPLKSRAVRPFVHLTAVISPADAGWRSPPFWSSTDLVYLVTEADPPGRQLSPHVLYSTSDAKHALLVVTCASDQSAL